MDELIVNFFINLSDQNPVLFDIGHFLGVWFSLFVFIFYFVVMIRGREILHFKRPMFFSVANVFVTYITSAYLKSLIGRPRPVDLPFETVGVFSFPSGHSAVFFSLALLALLLLPKGYGWIFFTLAIIISVSRLLIGVHYPSDIFGGWFLALVIFLILLGIWRIFSKGKLQ